MDTVKILTGKDCNRLEVADGRLNEVKKCQKNWSGQSGYKLNLQYFITVTQNL